ncbi:MAG: glucosamine-6-phosphate deaminase [Planctomycetota bacterium]
MRKILVNDRVAMGSVVAPLAAKKIRAAIRQSGQARLVVATGASQFEVLDQLTKEEDVDWSKVEAFHLDEYVGISDQHPASFCRYLRERFADRVPLRKFHYLPGDVDPAETIRNVGKRLLEAPIDVALVGIGENGHLAFNDPPADFVTEQPYILVDLDEPCRRQQVGEGWFESLDDVPKQAISMSIRQIMKCRAIFCSVPDSQKASAVRNTLEENISPTVPASILRQHDDVTLTIDQASASALSTSAIESLERLS